jgi:hypothetical protein
VVTSKKIKMKSSSPYSTSKQGKVSSLSARTEAVAFSPRKDAGLREATMQLNRFCSGIPRYAREQIAFVYTDHQGGK